MKKILGIVFLICTVFSMVTFANALTASNDISSDITVKLENRVLEFDQPSINLNGRVLVPLRKIFEELEAEVHWDDSNKEVTAILGPKIIKLKIGESRAYVNGREFSLDVPGQILNGRTLVPVRFVSESLGYNVSWLGEIKTVDISLYNSVENYNLAGKDYKIVYQNEKSKNIVNYQGNYVKDYLINNYIKFITESYGGDKSLAEKTLETLDVLVVSDIIPLRLTSTNSFDYILCGNFTADRTKLPNNINNRVVEPIDFKNPQIFTIIKNNNGKYEFKLEKFYLNHQNGFIYEFIDIDSDGINELGLLESFREVDEKFERINIYKYIKDEFEVIFNEGLRYSYGKDPYSYSNSYYFSTNRNNKNLLDIVFSISTKFNQDMYEELTKSYKEQGIEIDIPEQKKKNTNLQYTYVFDGEKYVANTDVYDYGMKKDK